MTRFKLVFFSPNYSTRAILEHLFQKYPAEIGKIGEYEQCAFISRGTGQFKATAAANPTLGTKGVLETVEEDRVEVLINDKGDVSKAIEELKKVHPYEEPAYDVYRLEDV
ncbi:GTP cyclohydrolase 1 type 2/Nif3 [Amanita rubescens]|nr:GTP cyclohydrolase 1 type 2/Nif3 [Amanita rubescens]